VVYTSYTAASVSPYQLNNGACSPWFPPAWDVLAWIAPLDHVPRNARSVGDMNQPLLHPHLPLSRL